MTFEIERVSDPLSVRECGRIIVDQKKIVIYDEYIE